MNTLTLQIKVPKVVLLDEITVELPYFCTYGRSHWAIFAENDIIEVNYYETIQCANIFKKTDLPGEIERFETTSITREEFMEAYNKVTKLINKSLQ